MKLDAAKPTEPPSRSQIAPTGGTNKLSLVAQPCFGRAARLAILFICALAPSTHAQTNNQSQWDCVISGSRNGLALLTLTGETNAGGLDGIELIVAKSLSVLKGGGINGLAGTIDTNGIGVRTSGTFFPLKASFFGAFHIDGLWSTDSKGRVTGSFLEIAPDRVTCATNQVAISTNLDEELNPVAQTNLAEGITCVTIPVFTNMVIGSFSNQMTCFVNRSVISSSTFTNPTAISVTNTLPDGSYCETTPIGTDVSGVIEQTICYRDRVQVSVSTFTNAAPINSTNVLPGGTFCETFPFSTNLVAGTFTNQTICMATQVNCTSVTNAVNFTGKITPGKRLTFTAKSSLGNFVIRGVPATNLTDLSGTWAGTRKQNHTNTFELFSLTSVTNNPNSYTVSGEGPGYTYTGYSLLSIKKKIALALTLWNGTDYQATRAVLGSFNAKKLKSTTTGIEAATGAGALTNKVIFAIEKR